MKKLDIEFRLSSTGSYSPWHLDIANEYNVPLMVTSDIGKFVKIGDDVYSCRHHYVELHEYLVMLEEMNNKGEISDEEVSKEVDDIINDKNKDFHLEKCQPLDEFRKRIIEISNKRDKIKNRHMRKIKCIKQKKQV